MSDALGGNPSIMAALHHSPEETELPSHTVYLTIAAVITDTYHPHPPTIIIICQPFEGQFCSNHNRFVSSMRKTYRHDVIFPQESVCHRYKFKVRNQRQRDMGETTRVPIDRYNELYSSPYLIIVWDSGGWWQTKGVRLANMSIDCNQWKCELIQTNAHGMAPSIIHLHCIYITHRQTD